MILPVSTPINNMFLFYRIGYILVDLIYQNIPQKFISNYPISVVLNK